jgi:soluble lytic murein transglycosylase
MRRRGFTRSVTRPQALENGFRRSVHLTRRDWLAVATLACAGLLACIQPVAAQSPATRDGTKDSLAVSAPASGACDARSGSSQPSTIPMGQAQTQTSDADVALVRRAIDSLRSSGAEEASRIEATVSDPVARKLVEWIILRGDNNGANFARYAAFIAADPSSPSVALFRRRAEAMLWVEDVRPPQVLSFFKGCPPQTAKGRLALARALTEQGDTDSARAQVRDAWRSDPMSADVENQVLESYPEFLTPADHKARMEKSLYARDNETAIRAARRIGGADLAIAYARVALARKGTDAKSLLEAVPAEAHNDAGYIFAYLQVLRHENKIAEAAKVMLSAPRDIAEIYDPEQWWIEREALSHTLLDIGDARSATLPNRPRKALGLSAISWRAGLRCVFFVIRLRRPSISPASRK